VQERGGRVVWLEKDIRRWSKLECSDEKLEEKG